VEKHQSLIIGAGVTGLATANFLPDKDYLVLEAEQEIGGYCKTVKQDGFVWDYSGHFFHFRNPEIERYLLDRMEDDKIEVVNKQSKILYGDRLIEFPFQKNIHQLPKEDFIDCLYGLFCRNEEGASNFKEMLYSKFGEGICERFLVPYNEKLYACDLTQLDPDAMGRFFPYANPEEIIRNFRRPDNASYNSTFTYPSGGAIQYINALKSEIPDDQISLNEALIELDLENRIATTTKRKIGYQHLFSSAPFPRLLSIAGLQQQPHMYTSNKVAIFNLGFDRKGWEDLHWLYFPEKKYPFYRVGFYDNIFDTDRMSLYVEIGLSTEASVDADEMLKQVLAGLKEAEITTDHRLISSHHIILDPAYVHITQASIEQVTTTRKALKAQGVYSMGRYGGWTYCAIEDNILEARSVVESLYNCTVQL
jgi:protoporphyrinogen oxidase